MSTIGNILWFLFGGLIGGLAWVLAGCLWCITILGIPIGRQCFKMATMISVSAAVVIELLVKSYERHNYGQRFAVGVCPAFSHSNSAGSARGA
jgi:hypothetical protein